MGKQAFVVKVAFPATSKALAVKATSPIAAALSVGYQCRGALTRPISYHVTQAGVSKLALTEAEMQGLRNRQVIYAERLSQ